MKKNIIIISIVLALSIAMIFSFNYYFIDNDDVGYKLIKEKLRHGNLNYDNRVNIVFNDKVKNLLNEFYRSSNVLTLSNPLFDNTPVWFINEELNVFSIFEFKDFIFKKNIFGSCKAILANNTDKFGFITLPQNYKINSIDFDCEIISKDGVERIFFNNLIYEIEFLTEASYLNISYNFNKFKLNFDEEKYISQIKEFKSNYNPEISIAFNREFKKGKKFKLIFEPANLDSYYHKSYNCNISPINVLYHKINKYEPISINAKFSKKVKNVNIVFNALDIGYIKDLKDNFQYSYFVSSDVIFSTLKGDLDSIKIEDKTYYFTTDLKNRYLFSKIDEYNKILEDYFKFNLKSKNYYFYSGFISESDYPVLYLRNENIKKDFFEREKTFIHEYTHFYQNKKFTNDMFEQEGLTEYLSYYIMKKVHKIDKFETLIEEGRKYPEDPYKSGALKHYQIQNTK